MRKIPHRRLVVISDLHLGGTVPHMMSQPQRLANFVNGLEATIGLAADESLELVIDGDFIDFLAIEPWSAFTADPEQARAKLEQVADGLPAAPSPFACVFDALRDFLGRGHELTIIVGNHDVELTIPTVQSALRERLAAPSHALRFIDDGSAYQVGRVLIEHGNRYDGANANDHAALRAHRSAVSRCEADPDKLDMHVSAGSKLVDAFVNPLKGSYPFLDLLQPQGKLQALLLLSFEPDRITSKQVQSVISAKLRQSENEYGLQPPRIYQVGAGEGENLDPELLRIFGSRYRNLHQPPEQVGDGTGLFIVSSLDRYGIAAHLRDNRPIQEQRLMEIHEILRRLLISDATFRYDGETESLGMAAARMISLSQERQNPQRRIELVIMGHTHLARVTASHGKPIYLNTGTWADLLYVPKEVIAPWAQAKEHFLKFLKDLLFDRFRSQHFTYADVRVAPAGSIDFARLSVYHSTMEAVFSGPREPLPV